MFPSVARLADHRHFEATGVLRIHRIDLFIVPRGRNPPGIPRHRHRRDATALTSSFHLYDKIPTVAVVLALPASCVHLGTVSATRIAVG